MPAWWRQDAARRRRAGAGVTSRTGALDLLLCNVVVIDAVLGVVKGDLGVKDGKIVGLGKGRQTRR